MRSTRKSNVLSINIEIGLSLKRFLCVSIVIYCVLTSCSPGNEQRNNKDKSPVDTTAEQIRKDNKVGSSEIDTQKNSTNNSDRSQQNQHHLGSSRSTLENINKTSHNDEAMNWQELAEGLNITVFKPEKQSVVGKSQLIILRIDPRHFQLNLLSVKENGTAKKKADQWALTRDLLFVTNAGMYQGDHQTSVGYMKNYNFVNNPHLNKYNAVAAFNRKDTTVPRFQIIDLNCQNWDSLKGKYHSLFQSIRMISCHGNNVWEPQERKWSEACLAEDKEGHAYFIFSRSPYTMHDFIDILVNSPIDFVNAMHLEGGPEASFYLSYKDITVKMMGSYETGFYEHNEVDRFWGLPNVIGVEKR